MVEGLEVPFQMHEESAINGTVYIDRRCPSLFLGYDNPFLQRSSFVRDECLTNAKVER